MQIKKHCSIAKKEVILDISYPRYEKSGVHKVIDCNQTTEECSISVRASSLRKEECFLNKYFDLDKFFEQAKRIN